MDHEGAAADGCAVHPFRHDAEIVGEFGRHLASGRDAVNVGGAQAAIRHRIERGVGMELELRDVGQLAEVGGFGGAYYGDGAGLVGHVRSSPQPPAGRQSGSEMSSSIFSKQTSSGMSSSSASGVCSHSTMLVIMRTPSGSCTMAMA